MPRVLPSILRGTAAGPAVLVTPRAWLHTTLSSRLQGLPYHRSAPLPTVDSFSGQSVQDMFAWELVIVKHTHTNACAHSHAHTHTHAHTNACAHSVHTHTQMHVQTHSHTQAHAHTHVMHAHTHTHTNTRAHSHAQIEHGDPISLFFLTVKPNRIKQIFSTI